MMSWKHVIALSLAYAGLTACSAENQPEDRGAGVGTVMAPLQRFDSPSGVAYEVRYDGAANQLVLASPNSKEDVVRWNSDSAESYSMSFLTDKQKRSIAVFASGTEPSYPRKRVHYVVFDESPRTILLEGWCDSEPQLMDINDDGVLELLVSEDRFGELLERDLPLWPMVIELSNSAVIQDLAMYPGLVKNFITESEQELSRLESLCAELGGNGECHVKRPLDALRFQTELARGLLRPTGPSGAAGQD